MRKFYVSGFRGGHPDRYVWTEVEAKDPKSARRAAEQVLRRTWYTQSERRVKLSGLDVEITAVTDVETGQQWG